MYFVILIHVSYVCGAQITFFELAIVSGPLTLLNDFLAISPLHSYQWLFVLEKAGNDSPACFTILSFLSCTRVSCTPPKYIHTSNYAYTHTSKPLHVWRGWTLVTCNRTVLYVCVFIILAYRAVSKSIAHPCPF